MRGRDVPITLIQKRASQQKDSQPKHNSQGNQSKGKESATKNQKKDNQPSTSSSGKEKDNQRKEDASKYHAEKRDITKDIDKSTPFSLETKIYKLKVSIPLNELVKNNQYKSHVAKMLKVNPLFDILNLDDDQPELIFGPAIDGQLEDSEVPPFYLSMRIHQNILH